MAPAATTLLQLRFEGIPNGESGETPTTISGVTYEAGVLGSGVYLGSGNQLKYAAPGNISATSGTVEFWIKPRWNGNDGQDHDVLTSGLGGGILIGKDGGNFWRIILNRFGGSGGSELGAGVFVNNWTANQWHYAAFTWSPTSLKVYIDGSLSASVVPAAAPPAVSATEMQIGADGSSAYASAVLDEVLISDSERTAQEIQNRYVTQIQVTALTASPDTIRAYRTWQTTPSLTATTSNGIFPYPVSLAAWLSTDSTIAKFDPVLGRVRAIAPGQATLTASVNGAQAHITSLVQAPVLPPAVEAIPSFLASPIQDFLWEIPVVVLRYLPTTDGTNLDTSISPDYYDLGPITLSDLKSRIDTFDPRIKFGLEQGSRFHAYKSNSRPSLGYRVVKYITIYEPAPPGKVINHSLGYPVYDADYFSIFERFDLATMVNVYGVKEVWIWASGFSGAYPSYNPAIHRPENFREYSESNMSSPVTGDISNSFRDNTDLPVYSHTYTVYGYNFRRSQAEALHNHGHQLEAILGEAARRQDGNWDLFWKQFVGQNSSGQYISGRCGWTHMPPNATFENDYEDTIHVMSDIEDWSPTGGTLKSVNVDAWGNLVFNWPDGNASFSQRKETQWYMYWWQSMPGFVNSVRIGTDYMTNWWMFTGNWDAAMAAGRGLHSPIPPTGVEELAPNPDLSLRMGSPYPNPASSGLSLAIMVTRPGRIRVDVVDVRGRRLRTLSDREQVVGRHEIVWDGTVDGRNVSTGIYWLVASQGSKKIARKLAILR